MSKKRILFRSGLLTLSLVCSFLIRWVDAEKLFLINWPLTADSIDSCNLSADGKELYCIDMWITWIEPWAFVNFPNLKNLYLSDNNIYHLYWWEFEWLDNLEHLNLENNDISELYPESFDWIRGTLKRLYLYNAGIRDIDSETFSWMENLELLNLDSNSIKYLSVNTFKWLDNLQELSLIGNYGIVCYPMWLFSWMDNVKLGKDKLASCLTYENILDICDWDWATQILDCSNKDIEFIPEYAFEVVDGAETSDPTEYHPKNVVNLNLSGNRIEYMTLNSLYWLDDLEYINLKGNPLICKPTRREWQIVEDSNEEPEYLPVPSDIEIEVDEWVDYCLELNAENILEICDYSDYSILDCSNRGITNIAVWAFSNVWGYHYINRKPHALGSILLNDNKISYIEPTTFMGELEWVSEGIIEGSMIDLSNNKLTRLDAWTFWWLKMWTHCHAGDNYIYLNDNQISEISPWAFGGLTMILWGNYNNNHIYLNNNNLSGVKNGAFRWISTMLMNIGECYR